MGKWNACSRSEQEAASHANTAAATPSKRVPLRIGTGVWVGFREDSSSGPGMDGRRDADAVQAQAQQSNGAWIGHVARQLADNIIYVSIFS